MFRKKCNSIHIQICLICYHIEIFYLILDSFAHIKFFKYWILCNRITCDVVTERKIDIQFVLLFKAISVPLYESDEAWKYMTDRHEETNSCSIGKMCYSPSFCIILPFVVENLKTLNKNLLCIFASNFQFNIEFDVFPIFM